MQSDADAMRSRPFTSSGPHPIILSRLRKDVVICAVLSLLSIPLSCRLISRGGHARNRDRKGPVRRIRSSDDRPFPWSNKPHLFDPKLDLVREYQRYIDGWAQEQSEVAARADDLFKTIDLEGQAMYAIYPDTSRFEKASIWDETIILDGPGLVPPRKSLLPRGSILLDKAPCYVAMPARPYANVHAHVMIDHLPALAYLRDQHDADGCHYLLRDTPVLRSVVEWIDPQFAAERVVWIQAGMKMVEMGKDVVLRAWAVPHSSMLTGRNRMAVQALRRWLSRMNRSSTSERESATDKYRVVYASRNSPAATHARALDLIHEKHVLAQIRGAMKRNGVYGTLEVFNGLDQRSNATLSLQEQFEIFSHADVVIGTHGGAFANIMWMGLDSDYGERPKVLEFLPTGSVQPKKELGSGDIVRWTKTYYHLFLGPDWIDYRHLALSPNSTIDNSFINLSSLNQALDDMWKHRVGRAGGASVSGVLKQNQRAAKRHTQSPVRLFIALGQGTTATHAIFEAMCQLGINTGHSSTPVCLGASDPNGSDFAQAHYRVLASYRRLSRDCGETANACTWDDTKRYFEQLRSDIESVLLLAEASSAPLGISDSPYTLMHSFLIQRIGASNVEYAALLSQRDPFDWARRRLKKHKRELFCKEQDGGLSLDLNHCYERALRHATPPKSFDDVFITLNNAARNLGEKTTVEKAAEALTRYEASIADLPELVYSTNLLSSVERVTTDSIAQGIMDGIENKFGGEAARELTEAREMIRVKTGRSILF